MSNCPWCGRKLREYDWRQMNCGRCGINWTSDGKMWTEKPTPHYGSSWNEVPEGCLIVREGA